MSQNSSTSSSSWHFLASFLLCSFLLIGLGVSMAWYLEAPSGDLVRIGRIASIDLKPHVTQPAIVSEANLPINQANVLVLGDSFSKRNIWQSEIAHRTGLTFSYYHYNHIGCISPWLEQQIDNPGTPAGQIIIVETIERQFIKRFSDAAKSCSLTNRPSRDFGKATQAFQITESIFPIDIGFISQTATHHFFKSKRNGRQINRKAVTVDLVRPDLFSNAHPDRLTYYIEDDEKWEETTQGNVKNAMQYLASLQKRAESKGKTFLFVAIPDKSSTYTTYVVPGQMPVRNQYDVLPALANALYSDSNYLPDFEKGAAEIKDFFLPNDTHISLNGYRFLAKAIEKRIRAHANRHIDLASGPSTTSLTQPVEQ